MQAGNTTENYTEMHGCNVCKMRLGIRIMLNSCTFAKFLSLQGAMALELTPTTTSCVGCSLSTSSLPCSCSHSSSSHSSFGGPLKTDVQRATEEQSLGHIV